MNLDFVPLHFSRWLPGHEALKYFLTGLALLLLVMAVRSLFSLKMGGPCVARLGGMTWKRSQFCRGWLITGDTGSGKTSSGINQLAHQVFQSEPKWGGLCIDEKGVYWETLAAMARHYGREHDLIHLQIRPNDTDLSWRPPHCFNLFGERGIPPLTYARFVLDTATSLGQGGDKGFFKSQAQIHIAQAIALLSELRLPITLLEVSKLLTNDRYLKRQVDNLAELVPTPEREAVIDHFSLRFLGDQPPEQLVPSCRH